MSKATKAKVVLEGTAELKSSPKAENPVNLTNMTLSSGPAVQCLKLATGEALLETAYGVSPSPELEKKCLWLHSSFNWTIKQNGPYTILIPTWKGKQG